VVDKLVQISITVLGAAAVALLIIVGWKGGRVVLHYNDIRFFLELEIGLMIVALCIVLMVITGWCDV
jgi:hypothetical protein